MFWQKRTTRDFHDEIDSHLQMETERLREQGLGEADAGAAARRAFGNVTQAQERFYESHRWLWWDHLSQDLRFSFRTLRKSPGFTAIAVLTLTLGIGANTAIFGLANAAFFRALPYPHAERLAFLWQDNQRTGETEGTVSYPNYADWAAQSQSFEEMAFIGSGDVLLAKGGTLQHVPAVDVSTNFLSVLGVSPLLGRDFTFSDALGPTYGAIIGYNVWQTYYGGDPNIIGRPAGSGSAANITIIGVMPQGFSFPPGTEIWRPRGVDEYLRTQSRPYPFFKVIGRLHAGVKWSSAQTEMDTIANRLAAQYPASDDGVGIRVVPLREQLSRRVRASRGNFSPKVSCLPLQEPLQDSSSLSGLSLPRRNSIPT